MSEIKRRRRQVVEPLISDDKNQEPEFSVDQVTPDVKPSRKRLFIRRGILAVIILPVFYFGSAFDAPGKPVYYRIVYTIALVALWALAGYVAGWVNCALLHISKFLYRYFWLGLTHKEFYKNKEAEDIAYRSIEIATRSLVLAGMFLSILMVVLAGSTTTLSKLISIIRK